MLTSKSLPSPTTRNPKARARADSPKSTARVDNSTPCSRRCLEKGKILDLVLDFPEQGHKKALQRYPSA